MNGARTPRAGPAAVRRSASPRPPSLLLEPPPFPPTSLSPAPAAPSLTARPPPAALRDGDVMATNRQQVPEAHHLCKIGRGVCDGDGLAPRRWVDGRGSSPPSRLGSRRAHSVDAVLLAVPGGPRKWSVGFTVQCLTPTRGGLDSPGDCLRETDSERPPAGHHTAMATAPPLHSDHEMLPTHHGEASMLTNICAVLCAATTGAGAGAVHAMRWPTWSRSLVWCRRLL